MKTYLNFIVLIMNTLSFGSVIAQSQIPSELSEDAVRLAKSNEGQEQKAAEWIASLDLNNKEKEPRLVKVITTHLMAIRDWHNWHPYTTVPEGINPRDGKPLSKLDRQVIANSAMPEAIHENLMYGLRKDLNQQQVTAILDKYTVGKVDFTMKEYHAIVPDLTEQEAKTIRGYLEEARERAVDYKCMKQISAIFEIYKTRAEHYLNSNGRNWRQLYKAYVKKVQAQKGD